MKVVVRHTTAEAIDDFEGLVDVLCRECKIYFLPKNRSEDDPAPTTSPESDPSASILYFVPAKTSKKRGPIPGVGYFMVTPPTSLISAKKLKVCRYQMQKSMVNAASSALDDFVKSLSSKGIKFQVIVGKAEQQSGWKEKEGGGKPDPFQNTVEDSKDFQDFLAMEKGDSQEESPSSQDSSETIPVPALVKFLTDRMAKQERKKTKSKEKEIRKKAKKNAQQKKEGNQGKKGKDGKKNDKGKKKPPKSKPPKSKPPKSKPSIDSSQKKPPPKPRMVIDPNAMSR